MKIVKKLILVAAIPAAVLLQPASSAVSNGDIIGIIDNGIPSNTANETGWVNEIITFHNGPTAPGAGPEIDPSAFGNGDTIDIVNYSNIDGSLPSPAVFDNKLEDPADDLSGVLGDGFAYAVAKYGGGGPDGVSVVYYLGGVGIDFPDDGPNQNGLSHLTFFNATERRVPDGGVTAVMLGLAVLGLAAIRRKS